MLKARQGLGMPQSQSTRLPQTRLHPSHAAKTMQFKVMFPDRLLVGLASSLEARIVEGTPVPDPAAFAQRLAAVMTRGFAAPPSRRDGMDEFARNHFRLC